MALCLHSRVAWLSAAPDGAAAVKTRTLDATRGHGVVQERLCHAVARPRPGTSAAGRVKLVCQGGSRCVRRPCRAAASRTWLTCVPVMRARQVHRFRATAGHALLSQHLGCRFGRRAAWTPGSATSIRVVRPMRMPLVIASRVSLCLGIVPCSRAFAVASGLSTRLPLAAVNARDLEPFPRIHNGPGVRAQRSRASRLASGRRCGVAVTSRKFDRWGRCGGGKRDGRPRAREHACSGPEVCARAGPTARLPVPGAGRPARRWGCPCTRAAPERPSVVLHARLGAADPRPHAAPHPQHKTRRGEERRGGSLGAP